MVQCSGHRCPKSGEELGARCAKVSKKAEGEWFCHWHSGEALKNRKCRPRKSSRKRSTKSTKVEASDSPRAPASRSQRRTARSVTKREKEAKERAAVESAAIASAAVAGAAEAKKTADEAAAVASAVARQRADEAAAVASVAARKRSYEAAAVASVAAARKGAGAAARKKADEVKIALAKHDVKIALAKHDLFKALKTIPASLTKEKKSSKSRESRESIDVPEAEMKEEEKSRSRSRSRSRSAPRSVPEATSRPRSAPRSTPKAASKSRSRSRSRSRSAPRSVPEATSKPRSAPRSTPKAASKPRSRSRSRSAPRSSPESTPRSTSGSVPRTSKEPSRSKSPRRKHSLSRSAEELSSVDEMLASFDEERSASKKKASLKPRSKSAERTPHQAMRSVAKSPSDVPKPPFLEGVTDVFVIRKTNEIWSRDAADQLKWHKEAKNYLKDQLEKIDASVHFIKPKVAFDEVDKSLDRKPTEFELDKKVFHWETTSGVRKDIIRDGTHGDGDFTAFVYGAASQYNGAECIEIRTPEPSKAVDEYYDDPTQGPDAQLAFDRRQVMILAAGANKGFNGFSPLLIDATSAAVKHGYLIPKGKLTCMEIINALKNKGHLLEFPCVKNVPTDYADRYATEGVKGKRIVHLMLVAAAAHAYNKQPKAVDGLLDEIDYLCALNSFAAQFQHVRKLADGGKKVLFKPAAIGISAFGNKPEIVARAFKTAASKFKFDPNKVQVRLQVYSRFGTINENDGAYRMAQLLNMDRYISAH